MAGRFSKEEILIRREKVSELYLKAMPYRDIALAVGVTLNQIFVDLKWVRKQWRTNTLTNFDQARLTELGKIDQVEFEAWKAWERSVGRVKTVRRETEAGTNQLPIDPGAEWPAEIVSSTPKKLVETFEWQAGDPRFLQEIRACIRQRCEILGLNAPIEARVSGQLSIDLLRQIIGEAEQAEAARPALDVTPDQDQNPDPERLQ